MSIWEPLELAFLALVVLPLGNGEYRIMFPQPIKIDVDFVLLAAEQGISLLAEEPNLTLAIGVEGRKGPLLTWLRSLEIIGEADVQFYAESMTERE